MGLGGVLVRKVFFKNRNSDGSRDFNHWKLLDVPITHKLPQCSNTRYSEGRRKCTICLCSERHLGADKCKWSSVKHYFCGDEFNSILAEDDFSSLRSSEAAVMQSAEKVAGDEEQIDQIPKEEENLKINLSSEDKAAIVIQSAFRGFRVRKWCEEEEVLAKDFNGGDMEQQSEATEALSTIAQLGDSCEAMEAQEAILALPNRELRKARSQMCRIKEEWDDSTLSSNVLKLRIQNKLEAMTRRERALAYAFSQQLRACSKKKSSKSDATDPAMGWSWLERWMAARPPENSRADDRLSRQLEPVYSYKRPIVIKKRSFEEKESCGSNDVAVSFHGSIETSQVSSAGYSPVRSMLKATGRATGGGYCHRTKGFKASKGDSSRDMEEKKCKQVQPKCIREIKFKDEIS